MTLTEFRALASKATPGEWWRRISQTGLCAYLYADGHLLADLHSYTEGPGPDRAQRDANAAWIAAASPTAILALIERLERAEAALRPFADYADDGPKSDPEIVYSMLDDDELVGHGIPIGHYRRALQRNGFRARDPIAQLDRAAAF